MQRMLAHHNMLVVLIALITIPSFVHWRVSTAAAGIGSQETQPTEQNSKSSFWKWLQWILSVLCLIYKIFGGFLG
ncbi:unnamed protein product [Heterobilharzia americana]|nr:unnamed protein product [Heterobilharzia americana]